MRRFSSVATSAASAASSAPKATRWTLARFFNGPPIEELVEMRTIASLQHVVEKVPANPIATQLTGEGAGSYRSWLHEYEQKHNLQAGAVVDKAAFEALIKNAATFIRSSEQNVLLDQPKIQADLKDTSDQQRDVVDAYVEAITLKLTRLKCERVRDCFEQMDRDHDGNVAVDDVKRILETLIQGSGDDWIRCQFQLYDTDGDDIVNESESQQILGSMILTQRAVLAELFEFHVANMPKKHMRLFDAEVNETNWKEKVPEKMRCVFHFALKEDGSDKTVGWESFKESQEIELPELTDLVRVYTKGIYDERYLLNELRQEKRSTRLKGVIMAIALAVGDYVFDII